MINLYDFLRHCGSAFITIRSDGCESCYGVTGLLERYSDDIDYLKAIKVLMFRSDDEMPQIVVVIPSVYCREFCY